MGMFDSVLVARNNRVNLPNPNGEYQTKDYDCTLARFTISEDGVISYTPPESMNEYGHASDAGNELVIAVKNGTFSDSCFCMHGDDESKSWHEFELTVQDNQITMIKDYGDVIFDISVVATVEKTEPMLAIAGDVIKLDGSLDMPRILELTHGIVTTEKELAESSEKLKTAGVPMNADGTIDVMALASKSHRRTNLELQAKLEGLLMLPLEERKERIQTKDFWDQIPMTSGYLDQPKKKED